MRMRMIKSEFWTDEKVIKCTHTARLLFIGLWNVSDEYGLMEWSPLRVKGQLFWYDDITEEAIQAHAEELNGHGLVQLYEKEGRKYLGIKNLRKHQRTDSKAVRRHPPPDPNWY